MKHRLNNGSVVIMAFPGPVRLPDGTLWKGGGPDLDPQKKRGGEYPKRVGEMPIFNTIINPPLEELKKLLQEGVPIIMPPQARDGILWEAPHLLEDCYVLQSSGDVECWLEPAFNVIYESGEMVPGLLTIEWEEDAPPFYYDTKEFFGIPWEEDIRYHNFVVPEGIEFFFDRFDRGAKPTLSQPGEEPVDLALNIPINARKNRTLRLWEGK